MAKPRVGIFDFTGCEGCQLQILNCEDELLEILGLIEIVNFREAMDGKSDEYDIALIDGGITTPSDVERIKGIREKAKLLVTIGSCSSTGGINCLKNSRTMDEVKEIVYGDMAVHFETIPARPVSDVVKVDLAIPGCPNYAVCMECKLRENECLLEKGTFCLGPVTRAGCEARCPSNGASCEGCRGLVDDPNIDSQKDVLTKYGLTVDQVVEKFKIYNTYTEVAK